MQCESELDSIKIKLNKHLLFRYEEASEYSSPMYNQFDLSGVIDRALSLTYFDYINHIFIIYTFSHCSRFIQNWDYSITVREPIVLWLEYRR